MKTTGVFSSLKTTYQGLSSQMKRLSVISENVANAKKLPDESGKVYRRKVVLDNATGSASGNDFRSHLMLKMNRTNKHHLGKQSEGGRIGASLTSDGNSFEVKEVGGEKLVYEPDHPKADKEGYVHMPDINIIEEMVDMVSASRAYEANVSVANAIKQVAKKTLEI